MPYQFAGFRNGQAEEHRFGAVYIPMPILNLEVSMVLDKQFGDVFLLAAEREKQGSVHIAQGSRKAAL